MIDASLNFEFGLFVIDLLADKEIITKKAQIEKEILPFTKNALIEYGTYAILSNLWIPAAEQLNQPFFNNMKIKASIINSEKNNTGEQLYKAFGSWEGKESAEDLINEIRNSRVFNRQIESL